MDYKYASDGNGMNPPTPETKRANAEEGNLEDLLRGLIYLLEKIDDLRTEIMIQSANASGLLTYDNSPEELESISKIKELLDNQLEPDTDLMQIRAWAIEEIEVLTDLDLKEIPYDKVLDFNMKSSINGSYNEIKDQISKYDIAISKIDISRQKLALDFYEEKRRFERIESSLQGLLDSIHSSLESYTDCKESDSYNSLLHMYYDIEKLLHECRPTPEIPAELEQEVEKQKRNNGKLDAAREIYRRDVLEYQSRLIIYGMDKGILNIVMKM